MVWQLHNLMSGIAAAVVVFGAAQCAGAEESVPIEKRATEFVSNYCAACHGVDDPEGGVNLDDLAADFANPQTAGQWRQALEQVLYSEMPPEEADDFPSTRERQAFVSALEAELSRHGQGFGLDEKMLLPEFGNLVDHKRLFSGEIQEPPYTPARLWRQRPDIYRQIWGKNYGTKHWLSIKIGGNHQASARDHVQHGPHKGKSISGRYFADERFANPFYEYVHHASGFTDYATIAADQASLEALLTNAEAMAEILTVGIPVMIHTELKNKDSVHGNNHGSFVGGVATVSHERTGRIPTAFQRIVDNDSTVSKDDFQAALNVAFELFLRRAPRDEDIEHYWEKVFLKNAELGNTEALQAVLIYVAISPEFVYRMEMGLGEKDEHNRRMLSPHELVYALHYALENRPAFGVEEIETDEVYQKNSDPLIKQFLTNSRTSQERHSWLVEQMRAGKLTTRDDVEAAVRELLGGREGNLQPNHNSPIESVKNPRILQFFREYFGYHKAPTVFKDVEQFATRDGYQQFHSHTPYRLMYDTDWLILHILQEDEDVLYELLTTNKVFFSYWNGENSDDQIAKVGGREAYVVKHDAQSYNLNPFEH